MTASVRIPDVASLETVLAGLDPASADLALIPALTRAFPGFEFSLAQIDDDYWRDARSVIQPDGTRIGELQSWMTAEVARERGDIGALWRRLKETELQITEWRGTSAVVFAPTGSGPADYVQISLGRETEWRVAPIVDPQWPPSRAEELLEPSWISREAPSPARRIAGSVYRVLGRAGGAVIHVRSFLMRCARHERATREARRPEMEQRVIHEVGPDGIRETPFLSAVPDWFDHMPREVRFFKDWEASSAARSRVFAHWALDVRDYEYRGQREIGFIPRPLRMPRERLTATEGASVHILMDRIEAIDREVGFPFGWFFLMIHGNWVDPDVGHAIARALKAQRVRLPDHDAGVLLRWVDQLYGF